MKNIRRLDYTITNHYHNQTMTYGDLGFFNGEEAAHYLGVSLVQLKHMRARGELLGCYSQIKKGGRIFYCIASLKDYMAKKKVIR